MIPQSTTLEIIAVLTGLASVWLASRQNILTWWLGLINCICLFEVFREARLYSDQMLQLYFFGANIYGIYLWNRPKEQLKIRVLSREEILRWSWYIIVLTFYLGLLVSKIHLLFPEQISRPAMYPWTDTFIAVSSIVATIALARKILQSWVLWILIDIACVYVYFSRELYLIGSEYLVFGILAVYGLLKWSNTNKK